LLRKLAIHLKDVVKSYSGTPALQGLSLDVEEGSIHGLLGPNGAGKTTTMRIITGLLRPTSGQVELATPTTLSGQASRILIGHLPESPPLYQDMRVAEYLNFIALINGVEKKQLKAATELALKKVGIGDVKNRLIGNLSKGLKQRVAIASVIVFQPIILILDEPTSGLDPESIRDVRDLILSLKGEHTILLSTHLLHEVELLCSHITIVNKGRTLVSGSLAQLQERYLDLHVCEAELENWNALKLKHFEQLPYIDHIVENEKGVSFFLKSGNTGDTVISSLSSELIYKDCRLISLKKKKMEVEDLFLKLTREKL
jgi:ABC-2 type transport system ATP-binding protein